LGVLCPVIMVPVRFLALSRAEKVATWCEIGHSQPCGRDANIPGPPSVQPISVGHKLDAVLTMWRSFLNTPPLILDSIGDVEYRKLSALELLIDLSRSAMEMGGSGGKGARRKTTTTYL
jgi:hypothetical protein